MTTEFFNTRTVSRQKLILKTSGVLLVILLYFFFHYCFAPEDVQKGVRHSRVWYSWNQLLIFSVFAVLILVPLMFWSRIILRISISVPDNKLIITQINRFRWTAKTFEVQLSQTQIQTEYIKETNYWLLRKTPEYFRLRLMNPLFGTLTISEQDFDNIGEIVKQFEQIKEDTAKKIRQRRLNKGK